MAVMLSNRLPFIALAVACVAAAAGGSYVATRQNLTPVAPAAAVALPGTPAQAGKPVQETEAVIGLQTETALSSATARVEDRVEARVVRDVRAGGGQVAIPAGSRALGSVMVVEHGGKFKDRARLGIRFHTLVLADGTQMPITTE